MNMKKRIAVLGICIITALGLTLAGCGDDIYGGVNFGDCLKVGKYKGMEAEPIKVSVSKKDITEEINSEVEAAAQEQEMEKGTAIEDGDVVNIDYEGKINGKTFDGGSAEGYDLTIGSGQFIEGFESGLIGKKIGDKTDLNLTFPEDYSSKDLAGKDVVFSVKINSAKRSVVPEYNDEFVTANSKYNNTAEFEKAVKKKLLKQKKEDAMDEQETALWDKLLTDTKVKKGKYPEKAMQHYEEVYQAQVDVYAEQYGTDRDTIITQYFGCANEEDFKKVVKDACKALIKQEMLIEYLYDKEGMEYTDEEKTELQTDIEGQGYDEDTIREQTGRTMDQYLDISLKYKKVKEFLYENAKIKK